MRFMLATVFLATGTIAAGAAPAPNPPPTVKPLTVRDAVPDQNGIRRMAILRALDKVTGRAIDISVPAGLSVPFGSLAITVRYCYTVPPEEPPETSAFIQIDDGKPGETKQRVFSGWMFASTPALNGLEHPVYDVWVITCKTDEPATAGTPASAPPAGPAAGNAPALAAPAGAPPLRGAPPRP
jgi:hypothetical protein